jgi:uncharacterized protein (DUF433 family)
MPTTHFCFDRITLDPNRCFGKPCIRDLRLPVASLLAYLGAGMSIDELLREWPELDREDVNQALRYAAWAVEERIVPLHDAAA